jgi:copper(I)-binding protein
VTLTRVVLPVAVLALALSGCAGKAATSSAPATTAPATSAAASPSASPSATPTAPSADQTIRITYANGKVSGVPTVVDVKHNATVALVVTSDVADEVHLHGYDKSAEVAKGGTVTIVFPASLQGRFEVELEKLKRRLVLLQVR